MYAVKAAFEQFKVSTVKCVVSSKVLDLCGILALDKCV